MKIKNSEGQTDGAVFFLDLDRNVRSKIENHQRYSIFPLSESK